MIFQKIVGFIYEIAAVQRCLNAGLKSTPQVPWESTLSVSKLCEESVKNGLSDKNKCFIRSYL